MKIPAHPLRLNIGFLIGQPIGTSHDFNFEYPEIRVGEDLELRNFSGRANFSRTPQGLFLQADFLGDIQLECVRCLDLTDHSLRMNYSELFAFDQRSMSESSLLLPESGYIDLEPLLREYTILEIPISPLCRKNCKGLCLECGENLNNKDCYHHQAESDTSFSELRSLLKGSSD